VQNDQPILDRVNLHKLTRCDLVHGAVSSNLTLGLRSSSVFLRAWELPELSHPSTKSMPVKYFVHSDSGSKKQTHVYKAFVAQR